MDSWILRVELDGEWEECSFATSKEALTAFAALAQDYQSTLSRAVLCSENVANRHTAEHATSEFTCVN
jgi:hypothetical protein